MDFLRMLPAGRFIDGGFFDFYIAEFYFF